MREIKFRAWNKRTNQFGRVATLREALEFAHNDPEAIEELEYLEFSQYTGLLDKQGKEIYEGDLMKTLKGIIWRIIRSPTHACWFGITPNIYTNKPWVGKYIYKSLSYLQERGLVIGNVWENPELLEVK